MTPRVSLALLVLALFSANQPSARAAAQMSNPVPGSTFSSSSITFNWTAGSATNYALLVGSSLYGHDVYSSGVINTLSATVNNIPIDGRTIFVTLASNVSGSWTTTTPTELSLLQRLQHRPRLQRQLRLQPQLRSQYPPLLQEHLIRLPSLMSKPSSITLSPAR